MSTQYRDGTFSEIEPFPEALERFLDAKEAGLARSLHIGTKTEIKEIQKSEDFKSALNDMQSRLSDLEAESSIIAKPTEDEIKIISGV